MTQKAEFQIAYDGEALNSHTMDVQTLAPALLAFGKLFDEANRALNGSKTSVRLHVKATSPGSFDITFLLDQSYAAQVTDFLSGTHITSASNLVTLISGGAGATSFLLVLLRFLKGKKPDKVTKLDNGFVLIELGQESLTAPLELLRLYQSIGVRKALEEILDPLKIDGIDTFKVIINQETSETIRKEEAPFYRTPEPSEEVILETEHQTAYSIVSLAFKDDNKWRLSDGNVTINVTIQDEDFRQKVDQNLIAFSKGDILICRVKTTQFRTSQGLKTEHIVLEVTEHQKATQQMSLL